MDYPKLRSLEHFPVTVSGKPMIGLRDPLNLTDGIIAFPHQLYPILILFDGKHSIVDIQAKFMRSFGELLYRDMLEDIIGKLDAGYFLDNENFHQMKKKVEDDFHDAPVRPAALAGKAYDDSPGKLAEELDSFFSHPEGPGLVGRKRRAKRLLKGIVAPHIDLTRGGPTFAWAYKEIAEVCKAKVFVVFGTSHVPTHQPFVLTAKDFETPFGVLKCNHEIVSAIQDRVSCNLFEDELVHRGEHSIEFQAVFLKYLFREQNDISIVPILCGPFHELMDDHASIADSEEISKVYSAMREVVPAGDESVCFIAGADLAHVGPRFGDAHPMNEATLKVLESDDLQMLESVLKLDPKTFLDNIEAEGNRRRICGLPPIYAMLNVMQARSAKLLKYQQWPDADATVTFASVAFY